MGEPQRGDYVDNIFLSKSQVYMKGDISGSRGDVLVRVSGTNYFELADAEEVLTAGYVIAGVDFDTTGLADSEIAIEAFEPPSYMYMTSGGTIYSGQQVKLNGSATTNFAAGQTVVDASAADFAAGKVIGRLVRLSTDQAGNNESAVESTVIVKMGLS